jgi:hypothetical protein
MGYLFNGIAYDISKIASHKPIYREAFYGYIELFLYFIVKCIRIPAAEIKGTVFYSPLLNLQLGLKGVDGLIEKAKTKFHTEEEIKSHAISSLAYDQYIDTYLHEGQHAIDAKYYAFAEWEREYRAKMSEPVYGAMPLMDITHQLKPDIGSNSTAYGKAHTKIFTDIVNYINAHKEDYPVIDTNRNIMMQLSKLSSDDIKEISKNVFEQVYPGEKYE